MQSLRECRVILSDSRSSDPRGQVGSRHVDFRSVGNCRFCPTHCLHALGSHTDGHAPTCHRDCEETEGSGAIDVVAHVSRHCGSSQSISHSRKSSWSGLPEQSIVAPGQEIIPVKAREPHAFTGLHYNAPVKFFLVATFRQPLLCKVKW